MSAETRPRRSWLTALVAPVAIVAGVAAVFAPTLRQGFVWDDDFNLVSNPHFRGFGPAELRWMATSFHLGHYHPLTWASFGLDYVLWGMNPLGYHLTNLVLHAVNAVLVYVLVRRLLGLVAPAREPGLRSIVATLGALLYALHPLRVESVAWVTERRDVLHVVFYLLAVLMYLGAAASVAPARRRWLAAALVAFAASLLAQAGGMTLPLVLLVLDAYPLRRLSGAERGRALREKLPFLVLAIAAAVLAWQAQRAAGAAAGLAEHGVVARAIQAVWAPAFYVWKTVLPVRLSPLYPLDDFAVTSPAVLGGALATLVIGALVLAGARRRPGSAAALGCYLLALAPVLGIAQSGVQVSADRYTYLAAIPFSLLAAAALESPAGRRASGALCGLAALAVIVLGWMARMQTAVWDDAITVWDQVVRVHPGSRFAWHNRGTARYARGDLQGARADFDRALALDPSYAPAYSSRGAVRQATGDLEGALADLDRAVTLAPDSAPAFINRGNARSDAGDRAGALADYDRAIVLAPTYVTAYYNRAEIRRQTGDLIGAAADLDRALLIRPDFTQGYAARAGVRAALGDVGGASTDIDRALARLPATAPQAQTLARLRAQLDAVNSR